MKNNKKINGQLLIESLIGVSIVVVGLLGIVGLVSRSLSLNRVVSDQFTASYLSLEGVEIARNLLDSNIIKGEAWNQGFADKGSYEVDYNSQELQVSRDRNLNFDGAGFFSYSSGGKATSFKRTIEVSGGGDEVIVNSIVKWESRGGEYEINNEHHFYNWRPAKK